MQARERVSIIDGQKFRSPETSLNTGRPILERALSLEEILRRKKLKRPDKASEINACPFRPGISRQNKETYVLLNTLENGRLVEIPGRGVFLIDLEKAQALAAPGKCQTLVPLGQHPQ